MRSKKKEGLRSGRNRGKTVSGSLGVGLDWRGCDCGSRRVELVRVSRPGFEWERRVEGEAQATELVEKAKKVGSGAVIAR